MGAVRLCRMLMETLDDENEENAAAERPATAAKMPLRLVPSFCIAAEMIVHQKAQGGGMLRGVATTRNLMALAKTSWRVARGLSAASKKRAY